MAEIPEKLLVNVEVTMAKVNKQLAAIAKKASQSAKGIEDDFVRSNGKAAAAFGKTSFAAGNLASQLNDIGTGLLMGQSPFQVMVQQGSQVTQVLQQTGGSVSSLGALLRGAFGQILNPLSLATFAVIGLGGAAIQYFTDTQSGTKEADAALKAHEELIRTIKGAYGEAAAGLNDYRNEAIDVVQALARGNLQNLKDQLISVSSGLLKTGDIATAGYQQINRLIEEQNAAMAAGRDTTEITKRLNAALADNGQAALVANSKYAAFKDAIDSFVQSINAGTPDVLAFRTAVSNIMNADHGNTELQKLGSTILGLTDKGGELQRAIGAMNDAMSAIGGTAAGQISDVKALTTALSSLASIALPALSTSDKISANVAAGTRAIGDMTTPEGAEARRRLLIQAQAAQLRVEAQQMPDGGPIPTPTKKPSLLDYDPNKTSKSSGGGGSKTNPYQSGVQSIKDRTAALQAENQALAGINPLEKDYGAAVTKARITQQLLNDAQRAHLAITPELRASIDALAAGYTNASVESRKLAESQREAQRSAEEFRQLGKDVLGGFINDLASGKSAADALSGALGKIADKLLDIALNSIFDGSGGGGGLLSGIGKVFGFANGGVMTPMGPRQLKRFASGGVSHQAAIFGEAGPEAAVPLPDGRSIPVTLKGSRAASGGVVYADHRTITIDARGAQQGVGAEIRKALSEYDRKTLPVRVKQIQQDPRMRG